jgi:hypothetical protein
MSRSFLVVLAWLLTSILLPGVGQAHESQPGLLELRRLALGTAIELPWLAGG